MVSEGLILSPMGVSMTALVLGFFGVGLLNLSLVECLLLGSFSSSTDAAAVFSVLQSIGIKIFPRAENIFEIDLPISLMRLGG